jgi:hypothetical protein
MAGQPTFATTRLYTHWVAGFPGKNVFFLTNNPNPTEKYSGLAFSNRRTVTEASN